MVDPNSTKFIASLVKSLQMLCHGYMEFNNNIEIIGHINVRIDNSQKFDYIVNEQVSKQGGESTFFQSNSYHSLPPSKCGRGERDHSGRYDDDGTVNNHHRLVDDSVARVQVDLSGPVPVTRSTSAPSPDGFFSTSGNSRRRSHSRDSRLHSVEEEQVQGSLPQDHSFNHSSISSKELELAANGTEDRTELLAMYKDSDRSRLHNAAQIMVKNEPNDRMESMDESGAEAEALDASSTSSMLPAAHQSALAAHAGHAMLATTTLGHPSFFDTASLSQQDGLGHQARLTGSAAGSVHTTQHSASPCASSDNAHAISLQHSTGRVRAAPTFCSLTPHSNLRIGNADSYEGTDWLDIVESGAKPPQPRPLSSATEIDALQQLFGLDKASASAQKPGDEQWCNLCAKFFRNGVLLAKHMQLVHAKHNPKNVVTSISFGVSSAIQQSSSFDSMPSPSFTAPTSSIFEQIPSGSFLAQRLIVGTGGDDTLFTGPSHSLGLPQESLHTGIQGSETCEYHPHSSVGAAQTVTSQCTSQTKDNFAASHTSSTPATGMSVTYKPTTRLRRPPTGRRCTHCQKIFQLDNPRFADHEHHCIKQRLGMDCTQCGRSFASKVALKDHVDSMHAKKGFQCRACGMVFKWRTYVYQHRYKCAALKVKVKREPPS